MPKQDIKPTRSELLEVKRRIKLSQAGYKILKMKRDGLILEFFKILEEAKQIREKVNNDFNVAAERITVAKAVDGVIAVKSAAFALKIEPQCALRSKNVMGLVVPEIECISTHPSAEERGYGIIGTSIHIEEAAAAFQNLTDTIIEAAEIETTMKRLLDEIERTKRRVNALEYKVIPELKEAQAFISLRLEEMERENIFRLKRIKQKAAAKVS